MATQAAHSNTIDNLDQAVTALSDTKTPDWLKQLRQQGLEQFRAAGIPSVKDEEWKYTNLAALRQQSFKIAQPSEFTGDTQTLKNFISGEAFKICVVNGAFDPERSDTSNLPNGVSIKSFKQALDENQEAFKNLISRNAKNTPNAFTALSDALLNNGIFISIAKNTILKKPIHVVHITETHRDEQLAISPRTLISVERSAEVTVLQSYVSFADDAVYFTNALTDIVLEENAALHYCKAQKESLQAFHISNTRVWQEKNSHLDGFSMMNGGRITRNNLDIILNGEGCQSTLNGLYCPAGQQHIDNHTSVDHRFPNCTSNQLYKGLLNGESRAVFNGKIFVKPIAQQTNSYQLNKNLLLGTKCRVDTKPQLEIFADDVKCTHGATIGQLNEDELFYLQTRCIPRAAARRILAQGFVNETVDEIKDELTREKLTYLLQSTFKNL